MGTVSRKSVATRLAIQPGHTVFLLNAPAEHARALQRELPASARIVRRTAAADRVVAFASSRKELDTLLPKALEATAPGGAVWIAYPKLEAGKSDLSRQIVHDAMRLSGWKPVAQISVDEVWSAIRARPAAAGDRKA
jgi:hypothetical protein